MTAKGDQQRARITETIESLTQRNGYSPTISEISAEVGLAKTTVFKHLCLLRDEGVVKLPRPGAGWMLT